MGPTQGGGGAGDGPGDWCRVVNTVILSIYWVEIVSLVVNVTHGHGYHLSNTTIIHGRHTLDEGFAVQYMTSTSSAKVSMSINPTSYLYSTAYSL